MKPLVSIVLPNYNHARFLPRRIESILAQTFQDFELIALDDCSTDGSRAVLEGYARGGRMRLVFNERNSGSPFLQWKKGAELAVGRYLWIAESDDFADPALLATLVGRLQANPRAVLAYCQSHNADETGRIVGTWTHWTDDLDPHRWRHDYTNSGRDEVANFLVQKNTIPNASAVLVDRGIFLEALAGSETMRLSGDWWTWCRVLLRGDVVFVSTCLNYFRSHAQSVRDTTRLPRRCAEEFRLLACVCDQVHVPPAIRDRVFHEAFYKWRLCVGARATVLPPGWLAAVHADARRVRPRATGLMALFLAKTWLKRIPGVPRGVRLVKKRAAAAK